MSDTFAETNNTSSIKDDTKEQQELQLKKQLAQLQEQLDFLRADNNRLHQENNNLIQRHYQSLVAAEQEEEFISNSLLRQIDMVKKSCSFENILSSHSNSNHGIHSHPYSPYHQSHQSQGAAVNSRMHSRANSNSFSSPTSTATAQRPITNSASSTSVSHLESEKFNLGVTMEREGEYQFNSIARQLSAKNGGSCVGEAGLLSMSSLDSGNEASVSGSSSSVASTSGVSSPRRQLSVSNASLHHSHLHSHMGSPHWQHSRHSLNSGLNGSSSAVLNGMGMAGDVHGTGNTTMSPLFESVCQEFEKLKDRLLQANRHMRIFLEHINQSGHIPKEHQQSCEECMRIQNFDLLRQ